MPAVTERRRSGKRRLGAGERHGDHYASVTDAAGNSGSATHQVTVILAFRQLPLTPSAAITS